MKRLTILLIALTMLSACKKESTTTGFIVATIDGTTYNFNTQKGNTSQTSTSYGVQYATNNTQTYDAISLTLSHTDQLSAPYTFTNNYTGPGCQIFFGHYQGGTQQAQYSTNNWSQSTTNTGFTVRVSEISGGMIKGTFSGAIRHYNTQSQPCCTYDQKQITNGSFSLPYN